MPLPVLLREGSKKWYLAMCDTLDKIFAEYMTEIGATPGEVEQGILNVPYDWTLQTVAGPLSLKSSGDTIFTRFKNPTEAKRFVDCNPYSGKWNFHAFWGQKSKSEAEQFPPWELLESLKHGLKRVMPTTEQGTT